MNDYSSLTKVLRDINQINFVRIFIIIIGAWVVMRMVERAVPWLAERLGGRFRLYILPSIPVLRLLIINVALILLVPTIIEPTLQNLAAIFAALAIALGFAVKDFGSSLVAGIVAIYERPYRPGDWVKIDRAYGEVKTVGLRAMRLVTPDDDTVTIPHLKFWDTNIYNANDGRRDLMCVTDFYLHPHHDGALVRRKLRDVALTSPYLNHERPIVVVLKEEVWGTHYKVRAYPGSSFNSSAILRCGARRPCLKWGWSWAGVPLERGRWFPPVIAKNLCRGLSAAPTRTFELPWAQLQPEDYLQSLKQFHVFV